MIEEHPHYAGMPREDRVRARVAVRRFMREGADEDQAVARSMSMAHAGRLDDDGCYVKVLEVTR